MTKKLLFAVFLCGFGWAAFAQQNTAPAPGTRAAVQHMSPVDANLHQETNEVAVFSAHLSSLKAAYAAKEESKVIAYEGLLKNAMRHEVAQLEAKVLDDAAQAERRKQAYSGQITQNKPQDAPKRDIFAEAVTPSEKRLESMEYTLAAFDRHAFDFGQPDAAAKDFAKLDDFLKCLQEELEVLKKIKSQE